MSWNGERAGLRPSEQGKPLDGALLWRWDQKIEIT